ncbi:hypothetical protein [Bifidobacterium sp. SO1]|uniref:hypothetical protein n=1 Tax=Bifidobacterium sp. SO1 TaxID=2809029 RepID=UPI001BDD1991|nr:hypothetical protein [Bifidobacterium sp. SO1]MBT1162549.1 hypothetical protein [Bifidobacterium sp. SO1]
MTKYICDYKQTMQTRFELDDAPDNLSSAEVLAYLEQREEDGENATRIDMLETVDAEYIPVGKIEDYRFLYRQTKPQSYLLELQQYERMWNGEQSSWKTIILQPTLLTPDRMLEQQLLRYVNLPSSAVNYPTVVISDRTI